MRLKHSFKTAVIGLKTNKSRSGLTILGIVIGITSIMMIMSVGQEAEALILNQMSGMGAEIVVIRPGREPKGPTDIIDTMFSDSLKIRDVEALQRKNNVPDLLEIAPAVIIPGSVSYLGETFRPMIFGWKAEFMGDIFQIYPEKGIYFNEIDIRQKASVVVIGAKVKKELFKDEIALGKNIKIKNRNFKVIGVLPPKGQIAFFNVDETVILPYTTAQQYLTGTDHFHEIMVKARSPEVTARMVRDIELTLRESHGITDPSKDDFYIVTREGMINQVNTIISVLTIFLSSVVAISLVVGGIGVMNIMLVSVTERTKEIGLRKALGATDRDILTQFISEAIILTAVGGLVGIILGAGFSFLISFVLTNFFNLAWGFSFPFTAAILGLSVSAFVGLVFGFYPARQASRKSPIEALRYE
ncbi:ABC transporter permease [Patescibacteria group bacterium]|nr:ABC transporter permease [Patescibacteria group bacterium]